MPTEKAANKTMRGRTGTRNSAIAVTANAGCLASSVSGGSTSRAGRQTVRVRNRAHGATVSRCFLSPRNDRSSCAGRGSGPKNEATHVDVRCLPWANKESRIGTESSVKDSQNVPR